VRIAFQSVGIQALLDAPKLKPGESPRVAREGANVDA
jgi:hypothetical protein